MEVLKICELFYLSPRPFVNLNLDNEEVKINVRKSVYSVLDSRYNMFIKREEHTDEFHMSALCVEVAPPPVHLTSF